MARFDVTRLTSLAATALIVAACGATAVPPATAPPSGDATQSGALPSAGTPATPSDAAIPSLDATDTITVIQYVDTQDPAAAAAREAELSRAIRDEAGMIALVGPNGAAVFATLDKIGNEFAQGLMKDVAAAIDAGKVPGEGAAAGASLVASIEGSSARSAALNDIDISMFANTGFTTSALMAMTASLIERADESGSGSLPRQDTIDRTADGLRQQVDLGTTMSIQTGGGRVMMEITMNATDRISDAASGSFVALYTSTSKGYFDVNACPDKNGVGEGKYTFETKHELNDVAGAQGARSTANRSVDAPFKLIDGQDARLVRIEASMDMRAGAQGPGSPNGPGPTSPFSWNAGQQVSVVMPASGSTTVTSASGVSVSGNGAQAARGSMQLSSAIAQLFLGEVGREAERFWRSGKCIEVKSTEDSRTVSPNETVNFDVTAAGKFDNEEIDARIKASLEGTKSLEAQNEGTDQAAKFAYVAGSEVGDKGTIALEQTGVRGIGKKTIVFEVGEQDYRFDVGVPGFGGMKTLKCDGKDGKWTLEFYSGLTNGSITFEVSEGRNSAPARAVYETDAGAAGRVRYDLTGTATFVDGDPPTLNLGRMSGKSTITAGGQSITTPVEQSFTPWQLEVGDFCTGSG